jgi:hypothetical protein
MARTKQLGKEEKLYNEFRKFYFNRAGRHPQGYHSFKEGFAKGQESSKQKFAQKASEVKEREDLILSMMYLIGRVLKEEQGPILRYSLQSSYKQARKLLNLDKEF